MKSFLQFLIEKFTKKHMVFALARMNPITAGHEKAVGKLKDLADKHKADHMLLVTHSHDLKKNPLTPEEKMKHLTRAFPDTNIKMTGKTHGVIEHLNDLHSQGYTHVTMVAGQDRIEQYKSLLNKYNENKKFKSVKVISAGKRNDKSKDATERISGTKMREFAKNNDFESFKNNLPLKLKSNNQYSKEIFKDVRK